MDSVRVRTYCAWISLGVGFFLVAIAVIARLLPEGIPRSLIVDTFVLLGGVVAFIGGTLGFPRWQAKVGLGLLLLIILYASAGK
jgi:hypothetical protein